MCLSNTFTYLYDTFCGDEIKIDFSNVKMWQMTALNQSRNSWHRTQNILVLKKDDCTKIVLIKSRKIIYTTCIIKYLSTTILILFSYQNYQEQELLQ